MQKDFVKKFYVANQREYTLLLNLAKEEDAVVIKIEPIKDYGEVDVYKIVLQGEINHLRFIEFLFNKKKDEMEKIIKQTGVI